MWLAWWVRSEASCRTGPEGGIPPSPNPFFVLLERGGQKKDSREQATKCGLRGGFEVRPRAEPAPKGESHPLRTEVIS